MPGALTCSRALSRGHRRRAERAMCASARRRQKESARGSAVLLLFGSRASGTPSFRCYQCRVANNEDCHDGYLKTCPTDQAYDVCMTMVVKNAQQGFFIEKKCALGPCNLRDEKQSQGLGLDTCDRSKDSYSCFECCKGDGCNTNAARRRSPLLSMPPLLLLTAVLAGRRA
ncbi:hypothetical protein MRX96_024964 [Rhipicephalus microplus]